MGYWTTLKFKDKQKKGFVYHQITEYSQLTSNDTKKRLTLSCEIEQGRFLTPIRKFDIWIPQFIKEGMSAGLQRSQASSGCVL